MLSSFHATLLGVVSISVAFAVTTDAQIVLVDTSKTSSSKPFVFRVEWDQFPNGGQTFTEKGRITRSQAVQVEVTNFNFIRYTLTSTTKDTLVPGYSFLESMWRPLIPILTEAGARDLMVAPSKAFLDSLRVWRARIEESRDSLQRALRELPQSVAVTDMAGVIHWRAWADSALAALERASRAAYVAIINDRSISETYYAQLLYESELARSLALGKQLQAFRAAAKETEEGRLITLADQAPGTRVVVTLAVSADVRDTAATRYLSENPVAPVVIEYFVSSDLPVVFHGGPVGSKIKDFKFDKMARGSTDLYQQISASNGSIDAAAFLSYAIPEFWWVRRFLASVGTNFHKPGETLYLGLTYRVTRRLLVSGGGVTALVSEGAQRDTAEADLFRTIREKRKWGGFISLSAIPY